MTTRTRHRTRPGNITGRVLRDTALLDRRLLSAVAAQGSPCGTLRVPFPLWNVGLVLRGRAVGQLDSNRGGSKPGVPHD